MGAAAVTCCMALCVELCETLARMIRRRTQTDWVNASLMVAVRLWVGAQGQNSGDSKIVPPTQTRVLCRSQSLQAWFEAGRPVAAEEQGIQHRWDAHMRWVVLPAVWARLKAQAAYRRAWVCCSLYN